MVNTKVHMPEPVAHAVTNKRHPKASIALHHDASFAVGDDDLLIEDLITTTQAEAYAEARVREALEEAALTIESNAEACHHHTRAILQANAAVIRALLPSTPA